MNLFKPLWFTRKGKLSKDGNGGGVGCLQIKIFIFCRKKTQEKRQEHRENTGNLVLWCIHTEQHREQD